SSGSVGVDANSVIAEGTLGDVHVTGVGSASATVSLGHSEFDSATAVGSHASVTSPFVDANVTAPPLLAADGYHELPGSPTIDAGATDAESGSLDVDGAARVANGNADIGADEARE